MRSAVRQARHSSPRLSPSARCRDTTSCVGVGRLSTTIRRVKKHHCHNRKPIYLLIFIRLQDIVPRKWPVNTCFFDRCRNRAGTQDFVSTSFPPGTHKSSTGCWSGNPEWREKAREHGRERRVFKPLETIFAVHKSGAKRSLPGRSR